MAIRQQNSSPRRPSRNPRFTKYIQVKRASGRIGTRNQTRSLSARRRSAHDPVNEPRLRSAPGLMISADSRSE